MLYNTTGKPVARVQLDDTVFDGSGYEALSVPPKPDAVAALDLLRESHYVVLVSDLASNREQLDALVFWINQHGVPYDDVWTGVGGFHADLILDSKARQLVESQEGSALAGV